MTPVNPPGGALPVSAAHEGGMGATAAASMRVLLVDPSLFTAPYDAALTQGLVHAGVQPLWAVRPTRPGDRQEIPSAHVDDFFYRWVDQANGLPRPLRTAAKGVAHVLGLMRLVARVARLRPHVVHFQWTVIPPLDALAIRLIRLWCPVVLTVHDTDPFNGERMSMLQNLAFDLPIRWADHAIVHTAAGRERLIRRGLAARRISVVPHGPLRLLAQPSHQARAPRTDSRWTIVLFGEIKPYKGLDLLIEAVARLAPDLRAQARFIVAGRARMDLAPLWRRADELGVRDAFEVTERRLSEQEMADLFAQADCFVFPYRQIDASGVYFLTQSLGKWMIASRVGIFAEALQDGIHGRLVPPEDVPALVTALVAALAERPTPRPLAASDGWDGIGAATSRLYAQLVSERRGAATRSRPHP